MLVFKKSNIAILHPHQADARGQGLLVTPIDPLLDFLSFCEFSKKLKLIWKFSNNYGKNCRLFHILAQFSLTTIERELDYYHRKVNARVALRVAKLLKS